MDNTYHSGKLEVALKKELPDLCALASNQEANVEQKIGSTTIMTYHLGGTFRTGR